MKGLKVITNPKNGFTVAWCHYACDPLKDKEWVENEKKYYPSLNSWKRMYEIDFLGLEGTPIHPTFSRDRHVTNLAHNPLEPMFRSWEFGVEVSVCKVYQLDKYGRVLVLSEFVRRRVESFRSFVSEALMFYDKKFDRYVNPSTGKALDLSWEDFGDFAGTYQADGRGQIYTEILADFNIACQTSSFQRTTKERAIEIVNRRLNENVIIQENKDGSKIMTPKFLIDESCEATIQAYSGGYVYGKETGRGLRPLDPNHPYEDVCDADHYFIINKLGLIHIEKKEEPDYVEIYNPVTGYF